MSKFKVLSLFAGIGGFDFGLERTGGFEAAAFCEQNRYCQRVLEKHWAGVPIYDDVRTLTADALAERGIAVDVITAGFPCQDISYAGRGAGLAGERSGLFFEVARLVGELGPRFLILENVSALLGRGLGEVLGTLASLGYDVEWDCIPAAYVGAHHRRDRFWGLAYRQGDPLGSNAHGVGPYRAALHQLGGAQFRDQQERVARSLGEDVADASGAGLSQPEPEAVLGARGRQEGRATTERGSSRPDNAGWWSVEPDVGRVADGVPARVDRLRALGNAVVPQIPELIGRAILAAHSQTQEAA